MCDQVRFGPAGLDSGKIAADNVENTGKRRVNLRKNGHISILTNSRIFMFSPTLAILALTKSAIVFLGSRIHSWANNSCGSFGFIEQTCIEISFPRDLKSSVLATKSVSQPILTMAATLAV